MRYDASSWKAEEFYAAVSTLEDFRYKLGISYDPMASGALGHGEIWALNRSIREYGKMPPYNSQIPGDTRYKR